MDDLPLNAIFLLISLILLSAFFSSAETAYSSLNKIRIKKFAEAGKSGSKKALYISENFDKSLSTILIGNNIVNIAAASISTKIATDLVGGNSAIVISTIVMTILILIFGEILPKSLAKEHAETYALRISSILFLLIKVLAPINFLFIKLKVFVSKFFAKSDGMPSVTEDELKVMLDISEEEGVIDKEERELIHRSMDFDDTIAKEILTPRMDMIAININQPLDEIKEIFFAEQFSRIPVYEGNTDNIIGILSERDFLTHMIRYKEFNVRELLREPLFIVESTNISTLLPTLQKEKVHMAIVLDEFSGTAGLITLEDILEEIVGEIWDEQDEKLTSLFQIDELNYRLDAQYPLDDFANIMNVPIPKSSYHTLGGWIIEKLEAIPEIGATFSYDKLNIIVDEVTDRRVKKIVVQIKE
ncbi:hemolysin family protein [Paraliobacillus sediminis]|uniref:hemolysin family protein n=1 Tax=Paraliobacillus sediminis TaxID=1885916 RepID=UPI000E3E3074|nr:hemolysin family protein [Paraliobacillus sediminis]